MSGSDAQAAPDSTSAQGADMYALDVTLDMTLDATPMGEPEVMPAPATMLVPSWPSNPTASASTNAEEASMPFMSMMPDPAMFGHDSLTASPAQDVSFAWSNPFNQASLSLEAARLVGSLPSADQDESRRVCEISLFLRSLSLMQRQILRAAQRALTDNLN